MLNQKPQINSLIASGKFVMREASKGKTTAECVSMESAQTQFASLQQRWKALLASGEVWGELLERALPEMEKLQVGGAWSMIQGTMGHATCRMYPMATFIMYPWQQLLVGHIQYVDLCEVLLGM